MPEEEVHVNCWVDFEPRRSRLEQQILLVILPAFLSIVRCNKEKKNTSIENKSKYF